MLDTSLACRICFEPLPVDARSCPSCGAAVPSEDPSLPARSSWRPATGTVERRQTTVLFCDLIDSTALSGSLDPEDLREVLHAFRDTAQRVIGKHAGFLASFMGDGVLALFGYPRAQEDDGQRAVRAGLELTRAIARLAPRPGVALRARVGIATGVVVVGPLTSGASLEEVAVGQTTNLAARLQSLAGPSAVVISDVTMQLVSRWFDCRQLGPLTVKGFDRPLPAFEVLGERTDHDATAPSNHSTTAPPLIGRERELGVLTRCWEAARQGKGGLVIIQGEPGVGKSRLAVELRRVASQGAHELLRYSCAPTLRNSTLFPVIRQIERSAGIRPDDGAEQKLSKLEQLVLRTAQPDDEADLSRLLAALLSVPFAGRYEPLLESPERLKQRTFSALKKRIQAAAKSAPLLLLIEDVHWADPTTIELLNEILRDAGERRLLVVATVRPGFGGEWPLCEQTTRLDLPRLTEAQAGEIVKWIVGARALPDEVALRVLRKSEGVPLFVEELTRTALDLLGGDEEGTTPSDEEPAIPSTLQDSLAARLDRLSAVKEVAQVAAVIGREFGRDLLGEVLPMSRAELDDAIDTLIAADLVRRHDERLGLFSFKHVLLQDAAYEMMLRSTRRNLHQRIGSALEARRERAHAIAPDTLAHHWIEAGEPVRALRYLEEAGRQAFSRAAHTEARRHFQRGLDLLSQVPESAERDEHEVRLSIGLALAASATQGYAAQEVEAAYQRALDLCKKLGNHAALFPALRGLCTFYIVRAALGTARDLGQECLRVAEQSADPADRIESATALGYVRTYQGALAEGDSYLGRAIELYRSSRGETLSYPSLQDPAVANLCLRAIVAFMMGNVRAADRLQVEALELAEHLGRPFNLAYAHAFAALHHNLRHGFATAQHHADQGVKIAEEHGFPVWQGAATMQGAIARGNSGDPETAIAILTHMLKLWQAGGAELSRPFFLHGLASCQRAAGRAAEAVRTLEEAIEQARRSGEVFLMPEHLRLRAEILQAEDPSPGAAWRREFELAAEAAREQGSSLFELRALAALLEREPQAPCRERATELVGHFRAAREAHEELLRVETLLARLS